MNTRAFVPACLWLLAVSGAALAEPKRLKLPPWEKWGEEDGVELFRRDVPGSGVLSLRGDGLIDASLLCVAGAVTGTGRGGAWLAGLVESRIVRRLTDTEHVRWGRVALPFPLADRDFVCRVKVELKARDRQLVVSFHSVKDSAAPRAECVRGEIIYGRYVLSAVDGGQRTRISAELLCDPKGPAARLVASVPRLSFAYRTIAALRREAAKGGGLGDPWLRKALQKEGLA